MHFWKYVFFALKFSSYYAFTDMLLTYQKCLLCWSISTYCHVWHFQLSDNRHQQLSKLLKKSNRTYSLNKEISNPTLDFLVVVDDIEVFIKEKKPVVPKLLQQYIIILYNHYSWYPGHERLEELFRSFMYLEGMLTFIRKHDVCSCKVCQISLKLSRIANYPVMKI